MAIAVNTSGASTETPPRRRELSVSLVRHRSQRTRRRDSTQRRTPGSILAGFAPAPVALYQLATFTGINRPYAHVCPPKQRRDVLCDRATASLWRY
jgi:hypothetical protein